MRFPTSTPLCSIRECHRNREDSRHLSPAHLLLKRVASLHWRIQFVSGTLGFFHLHTFLLQAQLVSFRKNGISGSSSFILCRV